MPRIYDSSHLTHRKAERAISGSFLSTGTAPNTTLGSRPLLGIKDSSILYAVKTGQMTQYTRFPTCIGISPGCPCPELNQSVVSSPTAPSIPGQVSGITFTVGSIILSWLPAVNADSYLITPYLNNVALPSVRTSSTSYRFTDLQEMQPYTFTVCGVNSSGSGPVDVTSSFVAPPQILGDILLGTAPQVDVSPSLAYMIHTGLSYVMKYAVDNKKGPTIASRLMYVWIASVVQAWNWVTSDIRIMGTIDNWNWDVKSAVLSDCDAILWICSIIDYITPIVLPNTNLSTYKSIYNCSSDVTRVKDAGQWNTFVSSWNAWLLVRNADGSANAITTMPITSSNWNNTIVVDGINDINGFPAPQEWTRLTIDGKKQGYLTYNWDNVLSTCLTNQNEIDIESSVAPADNVIKDSEGLTERDREIDSMMSMIQQLTDVQKVEAEFWAGSDAGIISPPLMAIWLWKEYVRSIGVTCPTLMYSMLDLAIHMFEGGRVTWRLKAKYMQDRPIQEVRRRYTGKMVTSWNGTMDGSRWVPYQSANFVTPPFADFPSGHSHFMKGFSLTMTKWFGPNITKNTVSCDNLQWMSPLFKSSQSGLFGDFAVSSRSSVIQSTVPVVPVTLSFSTWDDIASSAGMSRLYGGIHTIEAHSASQTVAVQIDGYVNSTWSIDFT
jgi:hypothetical protein